MCGPEFHCSIRRRALWTTLGLDADAPRSAPLSTGLAVREPQAGLLSLTGGQHIVADYAHTALILRRHPLALLRDRFTAMRLTTGAQVNGARMAFTPWRARVFAMCGVHKRATARKIADPFPRGSPRRVGMIIDFRQASNDRIRSADRATLQGGVSSNR